MMMNGWQGGGWTPPTPNPYGQVPIQPMQQPDWGQIGMMQQASLPSSVPIDYSSTLAALGKGLSGMGQSGNDPAAAQQLQQQTQQNQQRQAQFQQGAAPAANQALQGAMMQQQQRPQMQASPFAQQQGGLVNYLRQMYGMGH